MSVNPYQYIYKNLVQPVEQAAKKVENKISNTTKAVVNHVKDTASGWGNSYAKAVNQTNSSISLENGMGAAISAAVTKAKPGPTMAGAAVQYLGEIGVRTVSNAYNYFVKGQK